MTDGTTHSRRRLTGNLRRHAVAYAALFVALGGTAYAANTVGSEDVIDDSLTSADIQDFQPCNIGQPECLFTGGLGSNDLRPNAVITTRLANEAVTREKVRPDAIDSALIQNGQVLAGDLSRHAVTSDKIAFGAVQNRNLASGAVKAPQLDVNSVGTPALQDGAVTSGKLGKITVVQVIKRKSTDKADPSLSAIATCPSGSTLISGGGEAAQFRSADLETYASMPWTDGISWITTGHWDATGIPGTLDYRVKSYAVCLAP